MTTNQEPVKVAPEPKVAKLPIANIELKKDKDADEFRSTKNSYRPAAKPAVKEPRFSNERPKFSDASEEDASDPTNFDPKFDSRKNFNKNQKADKEFPGQGFSL